jgi:hypothetical protein
VRYGGAVVSRKRATQMPIWVAPGTDGHQRGAGLLTRGNPFAQLEYDRDPELRALLARAAQSSTVHRSRQRRQG